MSRFDGKIGLVAGLGCGDGGGCVNGGNDGGGSGGCDAAANIFVSHASPSHTTRYLRKWLLLKIIISKTLLTSSFHLI